MNGSLLTEDELARLLELAEGRDVLEIGTWCGGTAVELAKVARSVQTVDSFADGTRETYFRALERASLADEIVTHVGPTRCVLPSLASESFGLILHDAEHSYEAVWTDAFHMLRLRTESGVLAFHNYREPKFGVTEAVDDFGGPDEVVGTLAIVTAQ